ncbi:bestrophin family ion channel [Aliamphritea spongicola]|nr:bestrophin family ion channel [Aliamphritea spongicola]
MIIRPQPKSWELLFIHQGSIIGNVIGKIVFFTGFAICLQLIHHFVQPLPDVSITAMGVFGIALSLFLGFRNNAAYDRWWEARQLWGQIIADSRAAGIEVNTYMSQAQVRRNWLGYLQMFLYCHRQQLRGEALDSPPRDWCDAQACERMLSAANPAAAALQQAGEYLNRLHTDGDLDDFGRLTLARRLGKFAYAQAGNERIASTPLPFVYSLLVRRTTYLYCLLLPFALTGEVGWFSPLIAAVVAYVFLVCRRLPMSWSIPLRMLKTPCPSVRSPVPLRMPFWKRWVNRPDQQLKPGILC